MLYSQLLKSLVLFIHSFGLFWGRPHLLSSCGNRHSLGTPLSSQCIEPVVSALLLAPYGHLASDPQFIYICVREVWLSVAAFQLIERIPGSARGHLCQPESESREDCGRHLDAAGPKAFHQLRANKLRLSLPQIFRLKICLIQGLPCHQPV